MSSKAVAMSDEKRAKSKEAKGPKTVTLRVDVLVPAKELLDWTQFLTKYSDIFRTDHIGYWAFGERVPGGWLAYEQPSDDGRRPTDTMIAAVKGFYRNNSRDLPLPKPWFLIDRAFAERAFIEGIKRGGASWYEHGDANDYDCAVQMAALGEIRYG